MIPLRSSEPHYTRPTVNLVLIAINAVVFFYELSLGNGYRLNHFIALYGIVPDRLNIASVFTSMFIHGGWLHILGNMWFLWVFGRGVEDVLGHAKYLFFYLVCGVAAAIAHILVNFNSAVPTIGASGAIAGVMGAYLIKFPRARIITLVPIFFFITTMEIPAAFLLLWWFAIQFFSGFGSLGESDYSGGGTAFFAHIGGFIAGMLLIRFFPPRRRWRTWYADE